MTAIAGIFFLVVSAAGTSFSVGLEEIFLYLIENSKKSVKVKKALIIVCHIIFATCTLMFVFWGIGRLSYLLCSTNIGGYIAVIIYTLLLALMAANSLYLSPLVKVDSCIKAFRKGFTKASVNHLIPNLYIKTIINLFYLIILILAQIEDLKLATFPSGASYFCTLNKYGIVIVFAIEKIIKSFAPEKKRTEILTEAFVEQEKEDERAHENIRNIFKQIKASAKERRMAKKQAKKERKKNK